MGKLFPIADQFTLNLTIAEVEPRSLLSMGLIEKLENLINKILLHLGEKLTALFLKIIPAPVIHFFLKIKHHLANLKQLPQLIIQNSPTYLTSAKSFAKSIDIKTKLKETHRLALIQYAKGQENGSAKLSGLKKTLLTPFLMIGLWIKGLSLTQSFFLISFTLASAFASVGIVYSSKQLYTHYLKANRAPDSIEAIEKVTSDRPEYYKQQNRNLMIVSLRLPVFFNNINELRSIDVDFSAKLSNRLARMKLEKLEFQLRDHLILQVEPMAADFPLVEEGKDILRDKLMREINEFMKDKQVEGEVEEIKLTYILAN